MLEREDNELGQPVGLRVPDWKAPPRPARDVLHGRYCRLEPLNVERHAADLHHANSRDSEHRNWTYLGYGPFATLADYSTWLEHTCLGDDPLFYAVVDASSGKAVGLASYLRISPEAGSIEVGHLNFSPLLQRRPAATDAMYLMMRHAFELGYRRYEWKCNALNLPSRFAAMRLGLSYEGVFRQAMVSKGRNRDTAWYAAIDREWPALQAAFETWLAPENFDGFGDQRSALSALTKPILVAVG